MTIHVTWVRVLAAIGVGTLTLFFAWLLYGIICLWLFTREMKGKNRG